jgi:hypothetical protein
VKKPYLYLNRDRDRIGQQWNGKADASRKSTVDDVQVPEGSVARYARKGNIAETCRNPHRWPQDAPKRSKVTSAKGKSTDDWSLDPYHE